MQVTINGQRIDVPGATRIVAQLPIPSNHAVFRIDHTGPVRVPLTEPVQSGDRFITRPGTA